MHAYADIYKKTAMTLKTIFTIVLGILFCLTLWTCNKDAIVCLDNEAFCSLVEQQNFDATGAIINDFFSSQNKGDKDEHLEKLQNWLECKSCVSKVTLICNSCIKTLPAQSELSIKFLSNGQKVKMTLDIVMDDPLRFRAYH